MQCGVRNALIGEGVKNYLKVRVWKAKYSNPLLHLFFLLEQPQACWTKNSETSKYYYHDEFY